MVAVLAILAVLAIPEVHRAHVRSKSLAETGNLRTIEAAKAAFVRNNPGKPITAVSDLYAYLPAGALPISPWDAAYQNVTDLTQVTTSSANGDASKEPPIGPLEANGFNDLGPSTRVYMDRSTNSNWNGFGGSGGSNPFNPPNCVPYWSLDSSWTRTDECTLVKYFHAVNCSDGSTPTSAQPTPVLITGLLLRWQALGRGQLVIRLWMLARR